MQALPLRRVGRLGGGISESVTRARRFTRSKVLRVNHRSNDNVLLAVELVVSTIKQAGRLEDDSATRIVDEVRGAIAGARLACISKGEVNRVAQDAVQASRPVGNDGVASGPWRIRRTDSGIVKTVG